MNVYQEMRKRHQEEVNAFPMKFAFSQKQFERGMCELGLNPVTDTNKVVGIPGGGFIREVDKQAFLDLFERHSKEREEAIASDANGNGFAYWMFHDELVNHEYAYTRDISETLEALCLDDDDFSANPALLKALEKAKKDYLKEADEKGWC